MSCNWQKEAGVVWTCDTCGASTYTKDGKRPKWCPLKTM